MARKNNRSGAEASGSIHFDTTTKYVMAETTQDNVKEKVQAVREVVPGKSNNEVVLVLQYYDYNVERAIQAYLEDGAKEALKEWNFTGTKNPNKKRKNKKKGAGDKAGEKADTPATNGKIEPVVNGKIGVPNGEIAHGPEPSISPVDSPNSQKSSPVPDSSAKASPATKDIGSNKSPAATTETSAASLPQRQQHAKHQHHSSHYHHGNRDRANSARERVSARERTFSEMSSGSHIDDGHRQPYQGLEKAFKDLQRQTNSLERLRHLLDHEIDRSYKSVKSVFEELRKGLNDRESQLVAEMDLLKKEASEMLEMRQGKATELKRMCDRSEQLKEAEVVELRADIKHFVIERRHDEELGRTTRFLYDSDLLLQEINKFGQVVHVKSMYTARRPSASSVASSSVSHDEPVDDDFLQSQEMVELQDRLRTSLKLPNSHNSHNSHGDHSAPTQNGSDRGSSRNRQPNGRGPARQSDSARGPRQKPLLSSPPNASSHQEGIPSLMNVNSSGRGSGRGRGRGRGGRGGQSRGRGGPGGDSRSSTPRQDRPPTSSQGPRGGHQARVVVSSTQ